MEMTALSFSTGLIDFFESLKHYTLEYSKAMLKARELGRLRLAVSLAEIQDWNIVHIRSHGRDTQRPATNTLCFLNVFGGVWEKRHA